MNDLNEPNFRAQYGEDRIFAREFQNRQDGYYVDVGSYDGESYSNTFFLEKSLGWRGILIEADPKLHDEGEKKRPQSLCVNRAVVGPDSPATVSFEVVDGCRWVSSLSVSESMLKRIEDVPTQITRLIVAAQTLDSILEAARAPANFDLLSIDVEGHELAVLQGLSTTKWHPKIIILERNNHFPDPQIMRYMHERGYGWKRTTGCNDWFYAGTGTVSLYKAKLAVLFYAPKYFTIFKPLVLQPTKRALKHLLKRMGVLESVKRILKRNSRGESVASR